MEDYSRDYKFILFNHQTMLKTSGVNVFFLRLVLGSSDWRNLNIPSEKSQCHRVAAIERFECRWEGPSIPKHTDRTIMVFNSRGTSESLIKDSSRTQTHRVLNYMEEGDLYRMFQFIFNVIIVRIVDFISDIDFNRVMKLIFQLSYYFSTFSRRNGGKDLFYSWIYCLL